MTDTRCIPIEELARVRDLPEGSPERVHAAECPRCRARLLALAEFERGDAALPEVAGAGRAHAKLDALIDSLTSPAPAGAPAGARAERPESWLARLFAPPAARFAGAFAVLALVAASAWLVARGPASRTPSAVVRGEAGTSQALAVRATATGWELAWPPVPGADRYDVVFLDASLHEVARREGLLEPRLVLERDALPAGLATGVPLMAEIEARAGGDRIYSSVPAAIRLD